MPELNNLLSVLLKTYWRQHTVKFEIYGALCHLISKGIFNGLLGVSLLKGL